MLERREHPTDIPEVWLADGRVMHAHILDSQRLGIGNFLRLDFGK
jgi:hypothetical protein